jgi:hypothetical protein
MKAATKAFIAKKGIRYLLYTSCVLCGLLSVLFFVRHTFDAQIPTNKNQEQQNTLMVYADTKSTPDSKLLDNNFLLFVISLIVCLTLTLIALAAAKIAVKNALWIGAIMISIGLSAISFVLWYRGFLDIEITPEKKIEKKTDTISKLVPPNQSSTHNTNILIPTGLYITQLTIAGQTVSVSGYIWQTYPDQLPDNSVIPFTFPQALTQHITKAYTLQKDTGVTTGWAFRCQIPQYFNFKDYPFDAQSIRIQVWPTSRHMMYKFVPDLAGYGDSAIPQSAKNNHTLLLQEWRIKQSYFTNEYNQPSTSFGLPQALDDTAQESLPTLTYVIVINRTLRSSLIINLLPILILLTLIFIMLSMARFCTFHTLFGGLLFLFFISLIGYTNFKTKFPAQQIVFFDYIYFMTECIIVLSACLTIIYYKNVRIPLLYANHMLIPRLLYWPLICSTVCIISFIFFY